MNSPFSDTEKAALQRLMDDTYKQFVSKAATGRKVPFEAIDKLAGGRVYTGRQAKKLNLIDELGTVADAIASAKTLGGIAEGTKSELLILPKPEGVLESLLGNFSDNDVSTSISLEALGMKGFIPETIKPVIAKLNSLSKLLSKEPVVVIMPFDLNIH